MVDWLTDQPLGGRNSTSAPENIRFSACCQKLGGKHSTISSGSRKSVAVIDHVFKTYGL